MHTHDDAETETKTKLIVFFFLLIYTRIRKESFLFSHFFLSNSQFSRIDSELVSIKHFFGLAQQHLNIYFRKLNCKETDSLWCVRRFSNASSDNFLFSNRPTEYEQTNERINRYGMRAITFYFVVFVVTVFFGSPSFFLIIIFHVCLHLLKTKDDFLSIESVYVEWQYAFSANWTELPKRWFCDMW